MSRSAPRHAAPKHARSGLSGTPSAPTYERRVDLGPVRHHAATPVRTRSGRSRAAGIAAVTAAVVAIAGGSYVLNETSSADVDAGGVTGDAIVVVTASVSPSPTASATPTPLLARVTATPTPTPAPSLTSMLGAGTVALSPDTLAARQRAADADAAAAAKKVQDAKDAKAAKDRAEAAARASRSEDRPAPPTGSPKAIARAMMATYGWGDDQFSCLVTMWNHESGWNPNAENPGSGAYGIPQALPGRKMASAGSDWRTNPATQISWGLNYIKSRYNTPCGAWSFWQRGSWY